MRHLFIVMLVFFYSSRQLSAAEVNNLKVTQIDNRGVAEYSLVGNPDEKTADVTVAIEFNGVKYPVDMLSLKGDYGCHGCHF